MVSRCFYSGIVETIRHFFLDYPRVRQVWLHFYHILGFGTRPLFFLGHYSYTGDGILFLEGIFGSPFVLHPIAYLEGL